MFHCTTLNGTKSSKLVGLSNIERSVGLCKNIKSEISFFNSKGTYIDSDSSKFWDVENVEIPANKVNLVAGADQLLRELFC